MTERGSPSGPPFLFVALQDQGGIEMVHTFCALPGNAKRAAEARALIQGTKNYQVYRINQSKGSDLQFERVR